MFSEINLLSCDLDSTGSHQLLFNSKQDLSNYFKSRKEKTFKTRHDKGWKLFTFSWWELFRNV